MVSPRADISTNWPMRLEVHRLSTRNRVLDMDLQDILADHVEALGIPGSVLGVLHEDARTVACAGSANLESASLVGPDTSFQIASVTKPMNALVACRLAARGLLDFTAPLDTAIPELAHSEWASHVRIEQLLTNDGGIPMTRGTEFLYKAESDDALARLAAELAEASPTFASGTSWSYSNAAACLLGRLIEVLTGETYERALRSELFEPLGMTTTGFIHDRPPPNMATGYEVGETKGPAAVSELWRSRGLGPAGTTVWSTAGDLLRLAGPLVSTRTDYLDDYWTTWLRETTVELRIPPFMDAWCRSLAVFRWEGGPVWAWFGICTGFRAFWLLIPTQRTAITLLVNSVNGAQLFRALLPDLMEDIGVRVPPMHSDSQTRTEEVLRRYCGHYGWPDAKSDLTLDGDALRVSGAQNSSLLPIDAHLFRRSDGDPDIPFMSFANFDASGRPHVLYNAVWAIPRI